MPVLAMPSGGGVTDPALVEAVRQVFREERDRTPEPWLDKRGLAEHLACSVRSIQTALAQGLPHATIFGRVKFRVSEVEPWLAEHGHLLRDDAGADTLTRDIHWPGGDRTPPGLGTRR